MPHVSTNQQLLYPDLTTIYIYGIGSESESLTKTFTGAWGEDSEKFFWRHFVDLGYGLCKQVISQGL